MSASDDAAVTGKRSFSTSRVLTALIPLALLVAGVVMIQRHRIEAEAESQAEQAALAKLGLNAGGANRLAPEYVDADGDMIADPPSDPTKLIDPPTLVFSYIGAEDSARQKEVWKEFTAALSTAVGKPVEYLVLTKPDDQLAALKGGKLHVTAVNTGNVPAAVNRSGFVPDVVLAAADGTSGHTMKLVVPADSKIKKVEELRGKKLAFVNKSSNSGYKAPLVLLMKDFGMTPQRDFEVAFSYGHDISIHGIATGEYEAAPIAGDMLDRAVSRGELKPEQYRVIYESERFPSAALGHAYNLKPELVEKIKATYASFAWPGSGLEKEFAPAGIVKFVPADYKQNWSLIRRIGDVIPDTPTAQESPQLDQIESEFK
ncbi:MAG: phosphate/phosphite/phosphonate ABC transporter substrate-binding protein [Pirellulales bacterium]